MDAPLNTLHTSKEDERSDRLVIVSHKLQVVLVSLFQYFDLLQVLAFVILKQFSFLWILRTFDLDVHFFNLLGDVFDVHNILQELIVTHCKLNVNYF